MRILAAALLILLAAGIQGSPFNDLLTWQFDLLLAITLSWAIGTGPRGGLAMGFAAGAVQDMLLGGGFTYMLLKALIGLMAGSLRPLLNDRQGMVVIPLIVVFSLVQDAALAMALGMQGFGMPWSEQFAMSLPVAAGTALLGWPISLGVRFLIHRTRNPWAMRESQP